MMIDDYRPRLSLVLFCMVIGEPDFLWFLILTVLTKKQYLGKNSYDVFMIPMNQIHLVTN